MLFETEVRQRSHDSRSTLKPARVHVADLRQRAEEVAAVGWRGLHTDVAGPSQTLPAFSDMLALDHVRAVSVASSGQPVRAPASGEAHVSAKRRLDSRASQRPSTLADGVTDTGVGKASLRLLCRRWCTPHPRARRRGS